MHSTVRIQADIARSLQDPVQSDQMIIKCVMGGVNSFHCPDVNGGHLPHCGAKTANRLDVVERQANSPSLL